MFDIDIPAFISKFHTQAEHIPFENSDFQNLAFVVSGQQTPERMKRSAVLKLSSILTALSENYFAFKRDEIKLQMLEKELESANEFQKELVLIDIQEMKLKSLMTEKLVKDAIHSVNYLQQIIDALPDIESREAFELAEPGHFESRFNRQIEVSKYGQASGAIDAKMNVDFDMKNLVEAIPAFKEIADRFQMPLLKSEDKKLLE